jgi:hypothetical protein
MTINSGDLTGTTCGQATGSLANGKLTWNPSTWVGYSTDGFVLCRAGFTCSLAGLPNNVPKAVNDDNRTLTIKNFVFAPGGVSTFALDETGVPADQTGIVIPSSFAAADTFLVLRGKEISRTLGTAPACFCQ